METRRLLVSFSGGRTSAYMTRRILLDPPPNTEIKVVFANTGQEHERTLEFVKRCDDEFGFGTVWIEADPNPERGKGTRARVVNFESASRDGAPFEAVIQKHGIPNRNFPHCTRELKERPIKSYLRAQGWAAGTFYTAIGIRADEFDRMAPDAVKRKLLYPLVPWKICKEHVVEFWRSQSFDLRIPEHFGNCKWCWKKSLRKHLTIAKEAPETFDFPWVMEQMYPDAGPGSKDRPRRFFRGNRGADDILRLAEQPFDKFVDPNFDENDSGGCSDSCEVFS